MGSVEEVIVKSIVNKHRKRKISRIFSIDFASAAETLANNFLYLFKLCVCEEQGCGQHTKNHSSTQFVPPSLIYFVSTLLLI